VLNAFAGMGTAVAFFPVVKRQHEAGALGFVAAVILIGVVCLLAVVSLRQGVGGPGAADSATLVATGRALVAVRDWTFLLGPGLMPAMNALLLGTMLFRSRLVPAPSRRSAWSACRCSWSRPRWSCSGSSTRSPGRPRC
jgi:hypothetical protein